MNLSISMCWECNNDVNIVAYISYDSALHQQNIFLLKRYLNGIFAMKDMLLNLHFILLLSPSDLK